MATLKLRVIIIILLTDRPSIILPPARTTKNQAAFTLTKVVLTLSYSGNLKLSTSQQGTNIYAEDLRMLVSSEILVPLCFFWKV